MEEDDLLIFVFLTLFHDSLAQKENAFSPQPSRYKKKIGHKTVSNEMLHSLSDLSDESALLQSNDDASLQCVAEITTISVYRIVCFGGYLFVPRRTKRLLEESLLYVKNTS